MAQPNESSRADPSPSPDPSSSVSTLPAWRDPQHPTCHDRFRQIFLDHWHMWCDQRLEDEIPASQHAYVQNIAERLMLCRNPDNGYACYVCPTCRHELRVPFSCKTCFCPSCGKVHVDNWVAHITKT